MNLTLTISKKIQKSIINSNIDRQYIHFIYLTEHSKIGHYQINGIIKLAKYLNMDAIKISNKIVDQLKLENFYTKINISSPGFINIFLNPIWLSYHIESMLISSRLGVKKQKNKNILIDYSSPNMAKEMHVGHLRSTIIGDVIARVMDFLGYNTIRVNHIGDWGSQFGMIIAFFNQKYKIYKKIKPSLKHLENIYQKSKKLIQKNKLFSEISKQCVINLQNNKKNCICIWKKIIHTTIKNNAHMYKLLNVSLKNVHITGESFYINMLPDMIEDLKKKNIAIKKNNSLIIYIDEIKNKNGQRMGVIIQKKNTQFLYSTIDLACIKYRVENLKTDRIIYYTDIRQKQHLMQVCMIAKKAGYISPTCNVEHHTFGMVLSKNNRPFQTRDGKLIKLNTLINESIERAKVIVKKKNLSFNNKKVLSLSKIIGISAIKYADLSKNRNTNYIFNWDSMLSFNGNTSPYIQYTYTRIKSIIKKSKINFSKIKKKIILKENIEILLCIKILQFEEIILELAQKGTPHLLCTYLFQLSSMFSKFYEKYPIIFADTIHIKTSRLKISLLIGRIIKKGLNILGIKTSNYM